MSSSASLSPKEPQNLTIGSKTYKVSLLRMRGVGAIQRWLDTLPPPPTLRNLAPLLEGASREESTQLRQRAAMEIGAWPPDLIVNTLSAMNQLRHHEEGMVVTLQACLSQHQEFTREDAGRMLDDITMDQFAEILTVALGLVTEDEDDPKAGVAGVETLGVTITPSSATASPAATDGPST